MKPTTTKDETGNSSGYDRLMVKGSADGLFRACLQEIRSPHLRANRIRMILVTLMGLFTDKSVYREVLSIFYVLTRELERKLGERKKDDGVASKIVALGYHFTPGYEKDLEFLYASDKATLDWKGQAEAVVRQNAAASAYLAWLQDANRTNMDLAAAALVLWGGLVVGGGAMAQPRIKSAYGVEATHVFQDVIGPGREQRKLGFVTTWDGLAKPGSTAFENCVKSTRYCMNSNNAVLASISRSPWWMKYVQAAGVASLAAVVYIGVQRWKR